MMVVHQEGRNQSSLGENTKSPAYIIGPKRTPKTFAAAARTQAMIFWQAQGHCAGRWCTRPCR